MPSTAPEDPPVSVKAVLRCGQKWVLLFNERDEWELPGGRVERDDATLERAVARECREELGIDVTVGELVDTRLFEVVPGRRVTIVCFAATVDSSCESMLTTSHEHRAVRAFTTAELDGIALPEVYRQAISRARARQSGWLPR